MDTVTNGEANRIRACLQCGAPGSLLFRTTKGENPGRLVRVCDTCLRTTEWHLFGLMDREPIPEEIEGKEVIGRAVCWRVRC